MAARAHDALPGAAGERTPALGPRDLALGAPPAEPPVDGEATRLLAPDEAPALAAWLESDDGRRLPLQGPGPFVLGRGTGCDWREGDRSVSRRHARIVRVAGGFAVEDLGSLNGLQVNGQRVPRTLLTDGDVIALGEASVRFRCRLAEEGAPLAAPAPGRARLTGGRGWGRAPATAAALLAVAGAVALAAWLHARSSTSTPAAASVTPEVPQPADAPVAVAPPPQRPAPGITSGSGTRPKAEAPKAGARAAPARATDAGPRRPERPAAQGEAQRPPPARAHAGAAAPRAAPSPPARREDPVAAALARYRAGEEAEALTALAALRHRSGLLGARARAAHADLVALGALYEQGEAAFARGDVDTAARLWLRMVEGERRRFGGAASARAAAVRRRLAAHFHERAETARREGRTEAAWRLWRRAAALDPEGEGARALARLRAEARRLYREGYRLETVDLERARERWRRLIAMAPPDEPYRIKAEARLAWHARLEALRK